MEIMNLLADTRKSPKRPLYLKKAEINNPSFVIEKL